MTRAIVLPAEGPAAVQDVDDDFLAGEHSPGGHADTPRGVLVDVEWSSLNYKDGMAITGDKGVARIRPLIPGIDLVGTVARGDAAGRFSVGDSVVLNGAGIGETRHGGLAERALVDAASLVELPEDITPRRAAAIGTAGFTAMLSVLRIERDVAPSDGRILVTGSAGGVGSVAILLLSRLGYDVTASTGRPEQADFLRSLGAGDVIDRAELSEAGRPMQKPLWAGAVDSVGSATLANVLAQTSWGGTVTANGLAQGSDLPTTVLPFILRGVTLAGVNSVDAPLALREEAWARLAGDLDFDRLDGLTDEVGLADALTLADEILAGRVRGRTVVDVRR
ncbi:NADPH:quinone dehydrogenase [Frondihabitans sp. PAMC 28766]|uniref:MDR family oxidoreductase n=1 Tax=Frondihabitans sp. PAMC 28766 TaxID=1795630 RepID=UPI00078B9648|nr:MDR family oxidoreductase [Frondihabitans sp. PAMC 28766]AMM19565.1 NADPH:quinone dehydrogenase [Frondihabitans sp. PAMC 28766]